MKQIQRLYYILSYVFFILPPFIWGLVELYVENENLKVQIISLFVNLIVLAIIGLICSILIKNNRLHVPTKAELKYLLFGFSGNVVVYFYTFQNMMNIQNIITIYLILLIVLVVHFFLISRKISIWELWILLPIFLFIDTLHLLLTGCGYTDFYYCNPNDVNTIVLYIIYTIVFVVTVGYYSYKVYLYKRYNFYGIVNIILVLLISFFAQEFFDVDEKILGTLSIATIFFVVLDFIVSIVNKTYTHRTLLFYIRTTTILILFSFLSESRYFKGYADEEILVMMVVVTYASLGINILKSLLHVIEEAEVDTLEKIVFVPCTNDLKEIIKTNYGEMQYSHIAIDDASFTLVAKEGEDIVGFISTSIKPLMKPLDNINEAYLNIIEVHTDYQNRGIAKKLVALTEQHFKHLGISQLRGWSSMDKIEAIQLWYKLGYNLSPTIIWKEKEQKSIIGYYFIKQL